MGPDPGESLFVPLNVAKNNQEPEDIKPEPHQHSYVARPSKAFPSFYRLHVGAADLRKEKRDMIYWRR